MTKTEAVQVNLIYLIFNLLVELNQPILDLSDRPMIDEIHVLHESHGSNLAYRSGEESA